MTLADIVVIDSVINLMLLIFAGFIIVLIALVAYFLLKRAKAKNKIAERAIAKSARKA